MKILLSLASLLLVVVSDPGAARAGACAGPRHFAFVSVDGGRALQRNRPVTVRYGLNLRHRGSLPNCRTRMTPVSASAELSWSRHRRGPWTRIARGRNRQVRWTPTRLGLGWLRVRATGPHKERHTHVSAVLVGQGTVRLPRRWSRFNQAQLWAGGHPTDLVIRRRARRASALTLPRAAGWWLLSGRGHKAWARVTSAGSVRVTPAPARLRVAVGDILRKGWQVWIQHAGMPRVVSGCSRFCYLENLPTGQVRLLLRPAASTEKPRAVALTLSGSRRKRVTISAMHLLAGKPQPTRGSWTLFGSPALRAKPIRGACRNARPFDGPAGVAALGRALCSRSKKRKGWGVRVQPPGYLARGKRTAPVVYGKNTLWVESVVSRRSPNGRVLLYVATPTGVIVERVPLLDSGRAAGLTVTRAGDVYVVGRSNHRNRSGFVAVRRKAGWKVHLRPSKIRAVAASGRTVWALDIYGLDRCGKRCRKGPQSNKALRAFVSQGKNLRVVGENGALYAIGRRRLRRTLTQPSFNLRLSRTVTARGGTYGLFGPRITGSEYHPYCVGSVVARLTPRGWRAVHRVGGTRGRYLDCQNDDRRPPVVMDMAVAGATVYARRRARKAGLLPGYVPIYRARPKARTRVLGR